MLRILSYIGVAVLLGLLPEMAFATHNRAGEITYEQIGELTIRVTITTYTKTSSTSADRDSLELFWGDGDSEFVLRANGDGDPLPNDIKVNYYIAEHTYPGRATYTISMMDPNRIAGILNINFPNSVNVPFYIETTFTFLNSQFQGLNNSAILLQPPLDFGCVGRRFVHNPNAFDPDGDSLSYELIIPFQDQTTLVPDYSFPDEIMPGSDNQISLNSITGNFVWDAPQVPGEYNIAIRINEYRDGVLINSLIRDMQILIEDFCNNEPPEILTQREICVIAGDQVRFDVNVTDPDQGQLVALSASGGPFRVPLNPAILDVDPSFQSPPFKGTFIWDTQCEHISDQSYQVVFRAVDNSTGDSTGLADLKTVQIKVVGPPPEEIDAESQGEQINVYWKLPYDCEQTIDEYFIGFSVWRRIGSNQFEIDTCTPGLDGYGYEKIVFLTKENDGERYFISDTNVEKGKTYCYRVLAEFAQTTNSGNPFNRVQSLASEEICLQISRDLPLITEVSVLETNQSIGAIQVTWTKPLPSDLDTIKNPGPYRYELYRSTGLNNPDFTAVPGAIFEVEYFQQPVDTFFTDRNLNTTDDAFRYEVAFHVNGESVPFGRSAPASSIYLNINSSDEINTLVWDANVPWENYAFDIYRFNNSTGTFDSISTTNAFSYTDENLVNGREYCYRVLGYGSYGIPNLAEPLLNYSQESCGSPLDTVPPCPPMLSISNVCDEPNLEIPVEEFINELRWNHPSQLCHSSDDVAGYNIYFSPREEGDLQLVIEINGSEILETVHKPEIGISGCYGITAVDSIGNESELSEIICIDNCPLYELPNVFTPNGDGANELFVPVRNRFIDRIEMEVFNRWGQKVFETQDPEINWDGLNLNGKELAEGVYFYSCNVFEQRVSGVALAPEKLSGYIHIIRGL